MEAIAFVADVIRPELIRALVETSQYIAKAWMTDVATIACIRCTYGNASPLAFYVKNNLQTAVEFPFVL